MNSLRLYTHFLGIQLKGMMQHKVSFFLSMLGQILVTFNAFLGIHFLMRRFQTVEGFTYSQVLLCFSVVLASHTLAEGFFRGFDTFSSIISNGEFDRILVRPRQTIFMVLCQKVELTRVARLLQSAVMLCVAIPGSGISWTFPRIMTLVLMIMGGTVVFASIYLIYAAFCFFTLEGLEFINILTNGAGEFGKYPIGIYGKTVLTICTYLVPFALFQYYPFLYLIGESNNGWYSVLPLAACLFMIPCLLLWRYGLRCYQSTGS